MLNLSARNMDPYNNSAIRFLKLLLIIILVAVRLPPYGNDLLHVQVVNDEHSLRGIHITNGKVVIVTSHRQPVSPRPALRLMPSIVGKLIVGECAAALRGRTETNFSLLLAIAGSLSQGKGIYEEILEGEGAKALCVKLRADGLKAFNLEVSKMIFLGMLDDDGYVRD